MSLRKSFYFKPLCLLVAALFTGQCISIERKLVSTEEKVIENGSQYLYDLEKVKIPSAQDPTVEYRIVKFPSVRIESISTYKHIKVDKSLPIFIGVLAGGYIGGAIGSTSIHGESLNEYKAVLAGLLGAALGALAGSRVGKIWGMKSDLHSEVKQPTRSYLGKKPNSTPIPIRDFPLEFVWGTASKHSAFKTRTDEQGIVKINLMDDLKVSKYPPDRPLILYIHYLNSETQIKGIFTDSLGPEK